MGVTITVLGKSPSWQDASGACSGYLVEDPETALLLECGSGVFGQLRAACDYGALDAVLITHLHGDHMLDLFPFAYALRFGARGGRPISLHAPRGTREVMRTISGCWGDAEVVERSFQITEYTLPAELAIGTLELRLREVPHYIETAAVDVTSRSGGRFTFGSDCGPNPALVELALGTDLLIAEAAISEPDEAEPPGHMTAGQAGEIARAAGARRLLVTHISDEVDLDAAWASASEAYGGEIAIASAGAVIEL